MQEARPSYPDSSTFREMDQDGDKDIHAPCDRGKPGKSEVDKADEFQIPIITYNSLVSLITGSITWGKLQQCDQPEISAYSEGYSAPTAPPGIQHKQPAAKVSFSNLKAVQKHKEIPKTPDSPAATNHLVENLASPRGILDNVKVKKAKHPLYTSPAFLHHAPCSPRQGHGANHRTHV